MMIKSLLTSVFFVIVALQSLAQTNSTIGDKYIELNGVIMTADSLSYVPYAAITSTRGLSSFASDMGVFSMVVEKGDTLHFNSPGFRQVDYIISPTLQGMRYSILQLMVQDTFYLPETIFGPAPTKEEFDYAFKYWPIPDDKYEIARKNTEEQTLRILRDNMKKDGRENQAEYQRQLIERGSWTGMMPGQRIFSPIAWADFINAWQRGDFKKRKIKKK
jgi:hypothetical protein